MRWLLGGTPHRALIQRVPLDDLPTLLSPLVLAAVPVLLVLLRLAYGQLTASRNKKKQRTMSYVVKWGRERLHFPLPPPDTKLAAIRHQLAEYTQLPAQSFKLIHAGAVMKDDNAPLSAYGLKPNSTIALVGGGESPPSSTKRSRKHAEKSTSAERTEASTVAQIQGELDAVRNNLLPDVDEFLTALEPGATSTSTAPAPAPAQTTGLRQNQLGGRQQDLALEHVRLGELLLQALLRLDAITTEGEWEDARRERKGAVKEVQALLDRLDGGWRTRKAQRA